MVFRYCDTLNIMEHGRITKRMDRKDMASITASGHEEEYIAKYFSAPYAWAKNNERKMSISKGEKIGFWCAIDDLSFSIKKGDVTVLVDNNGTHQKKLQSLLSTHSAEANIYVDGHKWDISSRNCVLILAEPTVPMLFCKCR